MCLLVKTNYQIRADWMKKLRSAIAVSTLVGLSWILGVFALGEASFAVNVVFALSSSLQVNGAGEISCSSLSLISCFDDRYFQVQSKKTN